MADSSVTRQLSIFGREFMVQGSGDYVGSISDRGGYKETFEIFEKILKPDSVCLDVGANVGLSTLALASLATTGRVFAVEPDARTCQFLAHNIRANGLSNVTVEQRFMGLDGSRKTFLFCAQNPACSPSMKPELVGRINQASERWDLLEVESVSIDNFVSSHGLEKLDFIKLDCEGADVEILSSARHTLERFRPAVVLEFNSFCLTTFARTNPADAIDTVLSTFPYVWRILPGRGTLPARIKSTLVRILDRDAGRYIFSRNRAGRSPIERVPDSYVFIHDHIVFRKGFDNLLCGFSDLETTIASSDPTRRLR
jgi:FkbM family methyltransferase